MQVILLVITLTGNNMAIYKTPVNFFQMKNFTVEVRREASNLEEAVVAGQDPGHAVAVAVRLAAGVAAEAAVDPRAVAVSAGVAVHRQHAARASMAATATEGGRMRRRSLDRPAVPMKIKTIVNWWKIIKLNSAIVFLFILKLKFLEELVAD